MNDKVSIPETKNSKMNSDDYVRKAKEFIVGVTLEGSLSTAELIATGQIWATLAVVAAIQEQTKALEQEGTYLRNSI